MNTLFNSSLTILGSEYSVAHLCCVFQVEEVQIEDEEEVVAVVGVSSPLRLTFLYFNYLANTVSSSMHRTCIIFK